MSMIDMDRGVIEYLLRGRAGRREANWERGTAEQAKEKEKPSCLYVANFLEALITFCLPAALGTKEPLRDKPAIIQGTDKLATCGQAVYQGGQNSWLGG